VSSGPAYASADASGHVPAARPGTAARVNGGEPADLVDPGHYPVSAICVGCDGKVRLDDLRGNWRHVTAGAGTGRRGGAARDGGVA